MYDPSGSAKVEPAEKFLESKLKYLLMYIPGYDIKVPVSKSFGYIT